jgi:hypothetical protein
VPLSRLVFVNAEAEQHGSRPAGYASERPADRQAQDREGIPFDRIRRGAIHRREADRSARRQADAAETRQHGSNDDQRSAATMCRLYSGWRMRRQALCVAPLDLASGAQTTGHRLVARRIATRGGLPNGEFRLATRTPIGRRLLQLFVRTRQHVALSIRALPQRARIFGGRRQLGCVVTLRLANIQIRLRLASAEEYCVLLSRMATGGAS